VLGADCWKDKYSVPSSAESARQKPDHTFTIMAYHPQGHVDEAGARTFHRFEDCRDRNRHETETPNNPALCCYNIVLSYKGVMMYFRPHTVQQWDFLNSNFGVFRRSILGARDNYYHHTIIRVVLGPCTATRISKP
jgi:hypothetical protein